MKYKILSMPDTKNLKELCLHFIVKEILRASPTTKDEFVNNDVLNRGLDFIAKDQNLHDTFFEFIKKENCSPKTFLILMEYYKELNQDIIFRLSQDECRQLLNLDTSNLSYFFNKVRELNIQLKTLALYSCNVTQAHIDTLPTSLEELKLGAHDLSNLNLNRLQAVHVHTG